MMINVGAEILAQLPGGEPQRGFVAQRDPLIIGLYPQEVSSDSVVADVEAKEEWLKAVSQDPPAPWVALDLRTASSLDTDEPWISLRMHERVVEQLHATAKAEGVSTDEVFNRWIKAGIDLLATSEKSGES